VSLTRIVVDSDRRRLSEGMLIEATVLARLLGINLLTVDATVSLVPARPTSGAGSPSPPRKPAEQRVDGSRADTRTGGLAEAARRLDESARLLAKAKRNHPPLSPHASRTQ
jgi:hypothetical protein